MNCHIRMSSVGESLTHYENLMVISKILEKFKSYNLVSFTTSDKMYFHDENNEEKYVLI